MTNHAAIYARVSSSRQAQNHTVDSQVAALKTYAIEHNELIDEDHIFIDEGVSGASLIRPALDRLRDKAFLGEINKVFVLAPDRLARKSAHQLLLTEEFNRLHVEIVFINRTISSSPEDQLLLQIQGVISEYEREKMLERSRRGKLHKAKTGKISVLSGAPYGYVYIKKQDTVDARYEIHFEEARVVKNIYAKYLQGHYSINAIAKWLNEEGVATRKKRGLWERSTVWGILKNPAYKGEAAFKKTKCVERNKITKLAREGKGYPKHIKSSSIDRPETEWITLKVPAIITAKEFHAAARQLEDNKKFSPRNNKKYEYLLSGLIHCKECGYALYGKPASHTRYKRLYYRCIGQDGYRFPHGRVCGSHPVRVEVLDDLVWEKTRTLIEDPQTIVEEYSERCHKKENERSVSKHILTKKRQMIKNQGREKERMLDLYQKGIIAFDEIEKRLSSIRLVIEQLDSEIKLLQSELEDKQRQLQLIEQFEPFRQRLTNNLFKLTFIEKREIIKLLVKEVVVDIQNEDILIKHMLPISKESCPLRSGSHDPALR